MNLAERIDLIIEVGKYLQSDHEDWQIVKQKAFEKNRWFIPEFINLSAKNIVTKFLQKISWKDGLGLII